MYIDIDICIYVCVHRRYESRVVLRVSGVALMQLGETK